MTLTALALANIYTRISAIVINEITPSQFPDFISSQAHTLLKLDKPFVLLVVKVVVVPFKPAVTASQSVKGNAEEREFLLSWVDVVDYE